MLTQEIVKHQIPISKRKVKSGSDEHKYAIFSKTLDFVQNDPAFELYGTFKVKGTHEEGVLIALEEEFYKVNWDGLKCRFMEVYFSDTNKWDLYHPSELQLVK